MSTYFVAFRIASKTVNGKTYDERREAVANAVYEGSNGYWDEMTSFFIVGSSLSTETFAKKASVGLSKADDLLIVFDPEDMSLGHFGNFKHENELKSFFTSAIKV